MPAPFPPPKIPPNSPITRPGCLHRHSLLFYARALTSSSLASNYAKLLHSKVKRRPLNSQTCCGCLGTGDDPSGMLKGLANVISLKFFHYGRDLVAESRSRA